MDTQIGRVLGTLEKLGLSLRVINRAGIALSAEQAQQLKKSTDAQQKGHDQENAIKLDDSEDEEEPSTQPLPAASSSGVAASLADAGGPSSGSSRLHKFCMECGLKLPRSAKFCVDCGQKQP